MWYYTREKIKHIMFLDVIQGEKMLDRVVERTNRYIDSMPKKERKKYGKDIQSKPILIKSIGHMGKKSGLETLPEVIELIDD